MVNKDHFFWVVVWVEDGSGDMVGELPGHGLSEAPGALTGIEDVGLEEVVIEDIDGDAQTLTFTNNVGYLHHKFHIASPSTSGPALQGTLSIENPMVTLGPPAARVSASDGRTAEIGEQVIVSADVASSDGTANGVSVHFHVAHPGQDRHVIDIEMVPFIGDGGANHVSIPYRAQTCGKHELLIVANPGRENEVQAETSFVVPCLSYSPILPVSARQAAASPTLQGR